MHGIVFAFSLAAAITTALIGGVFLAFSSFVMPALARLAPAEGIRAMQSINILAVRSTFLAWFLGTAAICLIAGAMALTHLHTPAGLFLLLGAAAYLLGCFLVTVVGNVPLNNALAAIDPAAPASAETWSHYLTVWTRWNHLRTIACALASALCIASLVSAAAAGGKKNLQPPSTDFAEGTRRP